jgi:hypothetical protein
MSIFVVWLLFVLFYVVFVCKCVLPPGDNPIAVNKYIISYLYSLFVYIEHSGDESPKDKEWLVILRWFIPAVYIQLSLLNNKQTGKHS